ncbi:MAG: hypothetical protein CMH83_23600 [Nocardioides sp.]|nr:hypothetical protein [Nocardioides sp.]
MTELPSRTTSDPLRALSPWNYIASGIVVTLASAGLASLGVANLDDPYSSDDSAVLFFQVIGLIGTLIGVVTFLIGVVAQGVRVGLRAHSTDA